MMMINNAQIQLLLLLGEERTHSMSGRITSPAWWRIPGGSCASAKRSLTLQRVLMARPKAQGAASSSSSKALSLLARPRKKLRES